MADMIVVRQDREEFDFTITDANGDPLDLTDTLVIFGVKPSKPASPLDDLTDLTDPFKFAIEINGAGAVVFAKNFTLVGSPTLGVIRLTLLPTETTLLVAASYPTEMQIRYGPAGSTTIKSRSGPTFMITNDLVRRTTSP